MIASGSSSSSTASASPRMASSIALGVAGLGDLRKVGRVGGKAVSYFLVTTLLSATLGLVAVNIVKPGARLDPTVRAELLNTYSTDASARVEAAAMSALPAARARVDEGGEHVDHGASGWVIPHAWKRKRRVL